mgnify:CR=1 FL=1
MKGDKKIIKHLNTLLADEMSAIDLYFLLSRMFDNWGLAKLKEKFDHEMADEQGHASLLIERILFLEGQPDIEARIPMKVGKDVAEIYRINLKLELEVAAKLKKAIADCEACQDYQSRAVFQKLLSDTEEDHILWLETQLGLIDKVGLQNYLQSQM